MILFVEVSQDHGDQVRRARYSGHRCVVAMGSTGGAISVTTWGTYCLVYLFTLRPSHLQLVIELRGSMRGFETIFVSVHFLALLELQADNNVEKSSCSSQNQKVAKAFAGGRIRSPGTKCKMRNINLGLSLTYHLVVELFLFLIKFDQST